jgi:hypothetical protein
MPTDDTLNTETLAYSTFREVYQDSSRSRGFLTKNERKFILGELDMEDQQARNTRYRIRQHTIDGFLDIALLNRNPTREDIEQIADNERIPVHYVAGELVGAAYTLLMFDEDTPDNIGGLEDAIEWALRSYHPYEEQRGEDTMHLYRSISAELDVTDFDLKDVENRIQDGEATQNEMRTYYRLAMADEDFNCDEEIVEIIEPMIPNLTSLSEMADDE